MKTLVAGTCMTPRVRATSLRASHGVVPQRQTLALGPLPDRGSSGTRNDNQGVFRRPETMCLKDCCTLMIETSGRLHWAVQRGCRVAMVVGAASMHLLWSTTSSSTMHAHAATLTPYQRGLRLEYGLTSDDRIRKCDAGAQPNCVSTSSGTTGLYAPPFLAENDVDAQAAMDSLDAALKTLYGARAILVESVDRLESNEILYRRYAVPSALVDVDYVEVLINRDKQVFYRSQGSRTTYIWPIQQPISDLDAQRKRMASLRETLQWKILVGSCSVLECYEY